jgi:hypothetical protein
MMNLQNFFFKQNFSSLPRWKYLRILNLKEVAFFVSHFRLYSYVYKLVL